MKSLLRSLLIHLAAIWLTAYLLPGFVVEGGVKTFILGALGLMFVNFMIIPLLKIMFLPLNLLTLGVFTWVINVVGLYIMTKILPQIELRPFRFEGGNFLGVNLPSQDFNLLYVAVTASFLIGFTSHFLKWLTRK